MIIEIDKIKERDSTFFYELMESLPIDKYREIMRNDESALSIRVYVNDVAVSPKFLEDMYDNTDKVIFQRARMLLRRKLYDIKRALEDVTDEYKNNLDNMVNEMDFSDDT